MTEIDNLSKYFGKHAISEPGGAKTSAAYKDAGVTYKEIMEGSPKQLRSYDINNLFTCVHTAVDAI